MRSQDQRLGRDIALVLRAGTILAVALVAAGIGLSSVSGGPGPGPTPLGGLLQSGTPDSLVGAGMLVLTLTPPASVLVAAIAFLRAGERGRAATAVLVLVLLVASLAAAGLLGTAS